MNCEQAKDLMPLYLDQSLEDEQAKELRAHLLQCKACKNELIALDEVISQLQNMPMLPLPQGYHEELIEKIRIEAATPVVPLNKKKKTMAPWKGVGVAAAVVAVIFTAGGGLDKIQQTMQKGNMQKGTGKIVTADAGVATGELQDVAVSELATYDGAVVSENPELPSGEVDFENMDDIMIDESGVGGLPSGSVISTVVPSNEEIIIIDDAGLLSDNVVVAAPPIGANTPIQINQSPVMVLETEPIVIDEPAITSQSVLPNGMTIVAPDPAAVLASESTMGRMAAPNDPTVPVTQEIVISDTTVLSDASVAENDIAWEPIPEEDTQVINDEAIAKTTEQKNTSVLQQQPLNVQTSEQPSTQAVSNLAKSNVVAITLFGSNMQETMQTMKTYLEEQGGMVLREALVNGLSDTSVIPENRILFKIPNDIFDQTMEDFSKIGMLGEFMQKEESMDTVYDVLKQERNILEKNGYQNLDAQLAEYDRKIATWNEEENYTTVYITIVEKTVEEKMS